LLGHLLFGACDHDFIRQIVRSIEFDQISITLFQHFQRIFHDNFASSESLSIFQFDFKSFFSLVEDNQELEKDSLYEIPLNLSILPNIIKIEKNQNSKLEFTKDHLQYLRKFQKIYFANEDF
jgi:hypothetical protein